VHGVLIVNQGNQISGTCGRYTESRIKFVFGGRTENRNKGFFFFFF